MTLCYPGALSWSHSGNLAVNPAVWISIRWRTESHSSAFSSRPRTWHHLAYTQTLADLAFVLGETLILKTGPISAGTHMNLKGLSWPLSVCPLQLLISAGCDNGGKGKPFLTVTNVYCCSGHLCVGFVLDRGPQAYFRLSRWWVFVCSSGCIRFSLSEPWTSDRVLQVQGYFLYEKEPPTQIRTIACSGTQILECQVLDQWWAFSCTRQTASPHRGWEGWLLGFIYGRLSVSTTSVTENAKAHTWAFIFLSSTARRPRHTLFSPSVVEVILWPFNDTFRFTV